MAEPRPKSRRGRIFLAGGAVAALAVGGAFFLRGGGSSEAEAPRRPRTVVAAEGPLVVTVAATGVVQPLLTVEVKSKASGEVTNFTLEPGDQVEQGQLVCELDPTDEQRNVRLREAEVASNEAGLRAAEANLEVTKAQIRRGLMESEAQLTGARAELSVADEKLARAQKLLEQKLAPPEHVEDARAVRAAAFARLVTGQAALEAAKAGSHVVAERMQQVKLARIALVRSEIALEEARKRAADTRIVAPLSGVLLTKTVQKGTIVASGITSVSGGTTLATIADLSRIFIIAEVDESDIGRVGKDCRARITVDAHRGRTFDGIVERVLPLGVEELSVTTFRVKIEVTSPDRRDALLPNMTANVLIEVDRRDRCVLVPNAALKARGKQLGVDVVAGDGVAPEFRPIERGITDGERTEVRSGLRAGEVVALGDAEPPPEEGGNWLGRLFGRRGGGRGGGSGSSGGGGRR